MEMIEKKGDWIHTQGVFGRSSEVDVDYENLGISPPEDDFDIVPFRFNIKHLVAYNKSDEPRPTTLRLSDGYSYGIIVPFKVFDEFIVNKCKRRWYE